MAAAAVTATALATVAGMEAWSTVMPPYPATGLHSIVPANTVYAYTGTLNTPDGREFRAVKIGLDNGSLERSLQHVGQYAAVAFHAQQKRIKNYVASTSSALDDRPVEDILFEGGMYWPETPRFRVGSGMDIKKWIRQMEGAAQMAAEAKGLEKAFSAGRGLTEWYVRKPTARRSIEDDEVELRRVVNTIFPDLAGKDSDGAVAITLHYPVVLPMPRPVVLPLEDFPERSSSFRGLRGGSHAHDDAALSPHGADSGAVAPKGRSAHAGA